MKLKNKFYLLFLISCGFVLGVMGPVTFYNQKEHLYQNLKEKGMALCQSLSSASLNSLVTNSFSDVRFYIDRIAKEQDVEYVMMTDSSGKVIAHSEANRGNLLLYDPISIRAVRTEGMTEQFYSSKGKKIYEVAFPIKFASIKWGTIRIGFNLARINHQLMTITSLFLLLTFTVMGSTSVFFLLIGERITQPIKGLITATQEISRGNFSIKIPTNSKDEVGKLSRAFNSTAQTLKEYSERLKKKIKDRSIISSATSSLREILDSSKKFDLILNIAIHLSKASSGYLFSFSNEFTRPVLRAKRGSDINLERYAQFSHEVLKTQSPMTYACGKISQIKLNKSSSQGSDFDLIAYPLKTENTVWGVLILEKTRDIFTADELQTLVTFLDEVNLITENFLLMKILLESQQLDSFNKLTSVLLHDLRGAITQLSLSLQNAEKKYYNPQFREDFLATISNSIEKMHKLTERIGERPDSLKLIPYQINQILREIVDELELREDKSIKLRENYEDIPPMLIDPHNIKRAFYNIIMNALESMPEKGSLQIRSYRKEPDSSVYIDVKDSGVGMTQDFIENHLFKPFNSTKRNGLGLALYSSKEIINLHGGRIFTESHPGKGTKFIIKLPFLTQYTEKVHIRRYLGQYLLDMGAVTEDQLKKAMQIQAKGGKKIGNILIDMGYIREKEVLQALQKQKNAERKMLEALIKEHL